MTLPVWLLATAALCSIALPLVRGNANQPHVIRRRKRRLQYLQLAPMVRVPSTVERHRISDSIKGLLGALLMISAFLLACSAIAGDAPSLRMQLRHALDNGDAAVLLGEDRGECRAGRRQIEIVTSGGSWTGCWFAEADYVVAVIDDGRGQRETVVLKLAPGI